MKFLISGLEVSLHNPEIEKSICDKILLNLLSVFVPNSPLILKIYFLKKGAYEESLRTRVEHFR